MVTLPSLPHPLGGARVLHHPSPEAGWDEPSTQSLTELQSMMVQLEARVGQLVRQVDSVTPAVAEPVL